MYPALSEKYVLGKTIGSGGFAKVKIATHIATGEKVAIKIMNKKKLNDDLPRAYQEIRALQSLSHPSICKLYQVIETETDLFLVMEYCCGGELFDHIVQKEKLEEGEAKLFFRQIVGAVAYCHQQSYAHRDLKPENILLDNEQNLKIVDFGLCVRPLKGVHLLTSCGSPNYAAPELLRGDRYFGPEIDIWSLGVLLYALLCGNLPFDDDTSEKLYARILAGSYEEPDWLSKESSSLIKSLLQVDPKARLSTQDLCDHPWLNKGFDVSMEEICVGSEQLPRDEDCLRILGHYLDLSPARVWASLQLRAYDYTMATYWILLQRKLNRLPLCKLKRPLVQTISQCSDPRSPEAVAGATFIVGERSRGDGSSCSGAHPGFTTPRAAQPSAFSTPRAPHRASFLSGKRATKRIRSPGLEEREPIPKKIATSVNRTPVVTRASHQASQRTPSSARRVLEGIERGIRQVLTPRRSMARCEPLVLSGKGMVNVSSTNSTSPRTVLQELQRALQDKGITCTVNGFTLCGKLKRSGSGERPLKLSFELEVCWLPQISGSRLRSKTPDLAGAVVGIRRKRLKGDAWIYKCVCEEVLAIAASH